MLIREEEWKSQARRYDNQLNFSVQKVSLNYDFSMSFFRCTRKANELLNQRMYFMKLTPHYYQTIFLFPLPTPYLLSVFQALMCTIRLWHQEIILSFPLRLVMLECGIKIIYKHRV
jgi:hypothetical protein